MIIDTVEELFTHFTCYFKEIDYIDELNNIQDCLICDADTVEQLQKMDEEFLEKYKDKELVEFEFTNDKTNHIFVRFR